MFRQEQQELMEKDRAENYPFYEGVTEKYGQKNADDVVDEGWETCE